MGEIAIIGGSGFKDFEKQGVVFLQRHGKNIPPHKVDHKANLLSLKNKGVDTVIGICSVGSLKLGISPGSIVIPNDYINLKNIQTYHDLKAAHITPALNEELRQKIITAAKKISMTVVESGIYIQTIGPRLETKAEINMIKNYADIVGMTMANEATLAKELGIKYAAICSVDNYANGITKKRLTIEEIKKAQDKNKEKILRLLEAVL
ncbi:MAG: MTAP family purine nucleoside phosphorylase [DPANN group archaeon]|nr:MTAP family purine nucleoside phosphorylase [DPANN group archaeon]